VLIRDDDVIDEDAEAFGGRAGHTDAGLVVGGRRVVGLHVDDERVVDVQLDPRGRERVVELDAGPALGDVCVGA
jgi:hypothetical protein